MPSARLSRPRHPVSYDERPMHSLACTALWPTRKRAVSGGKSGILYEMRRRSSGLVLAAVLVSGVATALVAFVPSFHFAYRQHELHVSFETAAALIGILATYLLLGRFRQTRSLDDLVLFWALALFALTNLFFGALPAVVSDARSQAFGTWAALGGRFLASVVFAAASFAPRTRLSLSRRADALALLAPAALLAVVATVAASLSSRLPAGVEVELVPETSGRPRLDGHPVVLAVQLVATVLFAAAAVGFSRRGARRPDAFVSWLAVASALAAFSRLNYFLYPSLYTEWVYSGDAFRLAFYVIVLVAALREIASYWQSAAAAAVLEERRRIVRDLHDGLAQEVAFVYRNLNRLDPEDPVVARTKRGAERALVEARRGIAVLMDEIDQSLDIVLTRAAREVAEREGTRIALSLAPAVRVTPEQREALIRIVSEAITNAARHGGAPLVRVALEGGDRVHVRVTDTGSGFEPEDVDPRGHFGLTSMRERARALGGDVRVSSRPGRGTEVDIVI
jgi:signal transduction histidine kinase